MKREELDSRSHAAPKLIRLAAIASLLPAITGSIVMLGWFADKFFLLSVLPGLPTMKVNTALCCILSGLSLWCWYRIDTNQSPGIAIARRIAISAAAVTIFISGVTLSQYLFDWNSGLDQLILKVPQTDLAAPGRMSAATAFVFVLIGIALLFLSGKGYGTVVAQSLALIAVIISSLVLLAYLFVAAIDRVGWFSTVAVHTAFSFWVLGMAILALRSNQGLMRVYTQDTNSAKTGRRFLLSIVVFIPVIAGLITIGQRNLELFGPYFGLAILSIACITVLAVINWLCTRTGSFIDNEISHLNRVYALLSGVNTLIVRTKSEEELFSESCRIAQDTGKFSWVWIVSVDPDTHQKSLEAWAGGNEFLRQTLEISLASKIEFNNRNNLLQKLVEIKKPIVLNDINGEKSLVESFPHSQNDLLAHGIQSLALLPLIVNDKTVGVIALHASVPGFFDYKDMSVLNELSGDISFALNNLAKEKLLDYLTFHDPLTELANRPTFIAMLSREIQTAAKSGKQVTLVLLDIRRFRQINESLGRSFGDRLLKQATIRLAEIVPQPETLARLQSDLFATFLVNDRTRTVHQAINPLLHEGIGGPLVIDEQTLNIQTTLGIATFPEDGNDSETLLRNAEASLKKAKETNQPFLFYETAINERVAQSFALEHKLQRALEEEQFVLHYQPCVAFGRTEIHSVEALIRWNDPENGLVPPDLFIPLLEQTGLILEVGKWAMRQAIRDYVHWKALGLKAPRVAVNGSAIQLRDKSFSGMIVNLVTAFGDNEPKLGLELTESMLMENLQRAGITLKTLRNLGVEISIDDFGTGHSSLAYLARLPINTLKIDRSFVLGMTEADGGIALISAIISLAHSLELNVVAEGVETEEQAKMLHGLKCEMMQGYLFSKPVPFDRLAKMLPEKERNDRTGP